MALSHPRRDFSFRITLKQRERSHVEMLNLFCSKNKIPYDVLFMFTAG